MRARLPGSDLLALLGERIPGDDATQAVAAAYVPRIAAAGPRVLDLGCGRGESVDEFRAVRADVDWVGADIADSAEVAERARTDAAFVTFDGTALPFADGSFDAVFCRQVLEHVERPRELLADVVRVLRPGGLLAASTSQLEPFHSASTFNYTAHGLVLLLEDAGLRVREVRPGIDGLTLILRRGLGRARAFDRFWARESPLNRAIDLAGRVAGASPAQVNAAKLLFCGQLCVLAERPSA